MKVIVVGGGNVGTYIATELRDSKHDVWILEIDPDRVSRVALSGMWEGISVLNVDGCEVSELGQAHPEDAEVVVAVTGDDQVNLVVSLLAKQEFGVPRVIARVNNPDNKWLFNETWGVDVFVSTPHLLTALVEEAVSVGSLVKLLSFEGDRAGLAEVKLAPNSPANGKQIVDLEFPRDSTVVAILRQEHVIVPRGDTSLAEGDEVMVLVTAESEDRVRRLLIGED
jgi:trk system potassium uptake protein TrkA